MLNSMTSISNQLATQLTSNGVFSQTYPINFTYTLLSNLIPFHHFLQESEELCLLFFFLF